MVERFVRPSSVAEAARLRAGGDSAYLAGGTVLNAGGSPRVPVVICLDGLDLGFVREEAAGVLLGAGLTLQQLADGAPPVPAALAEAARAVGSRSIRCQATLGGNVAANRADSDLLPVLIALDARVLLATAAGETEQPIEQLVSAPVPEALVTAVRVPPPAAATRCAFERFARASTSRAVVGVALALRVDGDVIAAPRLVAAGVDLTVVRLTAAEAVLDGARATAGIGALSGRLAEAVAAAVDPPDAVDGSADFRRHLVAELAARALGRALAAPGGAP